MGADLLVTHHGIVWGGMERVTGTNYRRVAPLIDNDLALDVAHLPLDGHQSLGTLPVLRPAGPQNRAPFGSDSRRVHRPAWNALGPQTVSELAGRWKA